MWVTWPRAHLALQEVMGLAVLLDAALPRGGTSLVHALQVHLRVGAQGIRGKGLHTSTI